MSSTQSSTTGTTRVAAHATSVSWIPSEAVKGMMKGAFATGVSHYDAPPPPHIDDLAAMRDGDAFRFANRIAGWAEFDGDRVVGYAQEGGVVMGSTTVKVAGAGVTFAAVTMPDLRPDPEVGDGWVRFTQTSGGRTALPLPRRVSKPPFVRLQSPLVWSTLRLTLHADGRSEVELAGASPFPRHWVYDGNDDIALKAGVADWAGWLGQPSWQATPWGDQDSPVVVAEAESALERQLSGILMHGAAKPKVREVKVGDTLLDEGEWSKELFLVLDGVLQVSVGGDALGVLGPGAVVGERAVLENRPRTATLKALTPVRVAAAPADAIDKDALAQLSKGHRREEQ
ncbi:MAG TPA: cyclic nucleotide-binding domain-containing protein [Nocardioides sp.]|nr:cyclic nucleotide-binding domain-containing protein [Nocardioides sp.]